MDASGEQMTRVETVKLPLTEDGNAFVQGVNGFVTGVLVAKDVCGNVGMVGEVNDSWRRVRRGCSAHGRESMGCWCSCCGMCVGRREER